MMSTPRDSRGARIRGAPRGGARRGGSRSANASEDETSLQGSGRRGGRGNGNQSSGTARDFNNQTPQRGGANVRQVPRGPKRGAPSSRSNGIAPAMSIAKPRTPVTGTPEERYNKLKKLREGERVEAMRLGYVVDPDHPRALADAVTPIGTCPDMCPEYERVTRMFQNGVWDAESIITTLANGEKKKEPIEARMVKKFRRSAAGVDEQLPSDLRPPHVLLMTVKYLFEELIDQHDSLDTIHHFLWDRTRAIRNDFSIQQLTKTPDVQKAIESLEYIARFHILSLHEVGGRTSSPDTYDWQQDREQLDRTLLSLMHYYDDARERYRSPHETEFRAYTILFQLRNPTDNLEHRVQTWPDRMSEHPAIKTALALYAAASDLINSRGPLHPAVPLPIAQENWDRFWKIVSSDHVPYLMACVCEIQFNHIRRGVLNSIWHAFRLSPTRGTEDWTLESLGNVLYFEEEEDTQAFVEHQGFAVKEKADGIPYVDLTSVQGQLPDPSPGFPPQTFSYDPVEKKRLGRNFSAVLGGRTVKEAEAAGQLEDDAQYSEPWKPAQKEKKEESLFVTGHSDDEEEKAKAVVNQSITFGGFGQPSFPTTAKPTTQSGKPSSFGGFGQPSFPTASTFSAQETPKAQSIFVSTQGPINSSTSGATSSFVPATTTTPTTGYEASRTATNTPAGFANFGQPSTALQTNGYPTFGMPTATTSPAAQDVSKAPAFKFVPNPASSTPYNPTTTLLTDKSATESPNSTIFNFPSTAFSKPFPPSAFPASAPSSSPFNFGISSLTTPKLADMSGSSSFGKLPSGFSNPSTTREQSPQSFPAPQVPAIHLTPPEEEKKQSSQPPAPAAKLSLFQFPTSSTPPVQNSSGISPKGVLSSAQSGQSTSGFAYSTPTTTTAQPSTLAGFDSKPASKPTTNFPMPKNVAPHFEFLPQSQSTQPTAAPQIAKDAPPVSFIKPAVPASPHAATRPSTQVSSATYRPPNEEARKTEAMNFVARQMFLNPYHGLLKQYINTIVAPIVQQEMAKKQAQDDTERADKFREKTLMKRYSAWWKYLVRVKRLRRQGKEKKARLQAEREAHLRRVEERQARGANGLPKDVEAKFDMFRANLDSQRKANQPTLDLGYGLIGQPQQSVQASRQEIPLAATEQSNGLGANATLEFRKPRESVRSHKRSRTQPSISVAPNSNSNFRVSKSTNRGSPSPSLLSMSDRGSSMTSSIGAAFGAKLSTTKSNYFKLKALGITPPADKSLVPAITSRKRSRSEEEDDSRLGDSPSVSRRHIRHTYSSPLQIEPSPHRSSHISPSPVDNTSSPQPKTALRPEDEERLASVRVAIKAMEESMEFFREERQNIELGQSQTSASPSGSPAQNIGSSTGTLPKFYSRPSRFLAREEYGKRREPRKEDFREPVDQGMERAQPNGLTNGNRRQTLPAPQQPPRRRVQQPKPTPPKSGSGASADDAIEL